MDDGKICIALYGLACGEIGDDVKAMHCEAWRGVAGDKHRTGCRVDFRTGNGRRCQTEPRRDCGAN
jgi:hypothetical protein